MTTCAISPRRFPSVRFHVKMYNIAAATREPTPWQRNLASGGMTMAGAWRTPTLLPEAPLEALPEPPTSLGSSRANSRPPTAPHSRAGSRGGSLMVTPTVSPTTFERRKSWRAALSLDESAFAAPDTAPAPVRARRGLGVGFRPGAGAFSAASTPGWMLTPGPGGGTPASSLAEASQEDALDLGMRLMSKFARNSEGRRRLLRQVFAAWKHRHETIKRNTMYAMNIANLMRRALQRRNFHRWMTHSRARREEERVARHRRIAGRNKRMRLFRGWCGRTARDTACGSRCEEDYIASRGDFSRARFSIGRISSRPGAIAKTPPPPPRAKPRSARIARNASPRRTVLARVVLNERAKPRRRYFAARRDDAARSAAPTRGDEMRDASVRRTLARAFAGWSETATSIHRERKLAPRVGEATGRRPRRRSSGWTRRRDARVGTPSETRGGCVAAVARRRLFLAFAAWRENTARTRRAVAWWIERFGARSRHASRAFHRWATTTAAQKTRTVAPRARFAAATIGSRGRARDSLAARRRLARRVHRVERVVSSRARNGRKLRACVADFEMREPRARSTRGSTRAREYAAFDASSRVIAKMTRRRVAEAF